MGHYLAPFSYLLSAFAELGDSFSNSLNDVRFMINNIRGYFSGMIVDIFGVFLNLIIEFQKMIIAIRDMMGKFNAVLIVLIYVIDGTMMTMQSLWNGIPGQLTRKIGNCFHPNTWVKMEDGLVVQMKKIKPGATLKGGEKVRAVLHIDNTLKEPFYVYSGQGENQSDIYVTGSHFVFCDDEQKKIQVEKDTRAHRVKGKKPLKTFCCLITDTHRIPLGNMTFWDWDDFSL